MKLADLLKEAIDHSKTEFQILNECVCNATAVKRKKDAPAHTRITFATQCMDPGDLIHNNPRFRGIVIWIPADEYDRLAK